MNLDILKITILTGRGMDECILVTTLIEDTFPQESNLGLRFHTRPHNGEIYCNEHFPNIPLEIINVASRYQKTIR